MCVCLINLSTAYSRIRSTYSGSFCRQPHYQRNPQAFPQLVTLCSLWQCCQRQALVAIEVLLLMWAIILWINPYFFGGRYSR